MVQRGARSSPLRSHALAFVYPLTLLPPYSTFPTPPICKLFRSPVNAQQCKEGCVVFNNIVTCNPGYYVDLTNLDPITSPCKPADAGSHVPTNASWPVGTSIARNQTICPAGTFQSASGANFCFKCPSSTYSNSTGRITECDPCPKGESQDEKGATSCKSCANKDTPAGSSQCLNCPAGEWETDTGTCDPCPRGFACSGKTETNQIKPTKIACSGAGLYAVGTGTLACAPVPPGSYKKLEAGAEDPSFEIVSGAAANSEMETCPVGYTCTGDAARPAACPNAETPSGSATCSPCKVGQYPSNGECATCEIGFKCPDGVTKSPCPANEYAESTGSTICFPVVAGFSRTSASAVEECPVGYSCAGKNTTKEPCPIGKFATVKGANACSPCATGTFTESTGNALCSMCPNILATCDGGQLILEKNAWYEPLGITRTRVDKDTAMYPCFNDECCILSDSKTRTRCDADKGYTGPLCGACDVAKGAMRSGSGCMYCWDAVTNSFAAIGLATLVLGFVVYLVIQHIFAVPLGVYIAPVQRLALSFLQMLGVLGIFKAKGEQGTDGVTPQSLLFSLTHSSPLRTHPHTHNTHNTRNAILQ